VQSLRVVLARMWDGGRIPGQALAAGRMPAALDDRPRCEFGECDGSGFLESETDGYRVTGVCRCLEAKGLRWRLSRAFDGSGLPPRFNCGLAELDSRDPAAIREAAAYVAGWPSQRGLTILGPYGVGKTTLACAIAVDVIRLGAVVVCRRTLSVLNRLRSGVRSGELDELIASLQQADLLVLDDIGTHTCSAFAADCLFEVIDERYAHMRPTIVTAMRPLEDVASSAGDAVADRWGGIIDRLEEVNDVLLLEGESRRRPA
jgi:hypothetical protein